MITQAIAGKFLAEMQGLAITQILLVCILSGALDRKHLMHKLHPVHVIELARRCAQMKLYVTVFEQMA